MKCKECNKTLKYKGPNYLGIHIYECKKCGMPYSLLELVIDATELEVIEITCDSIWDKLHMDCKPNKEELSIWYDMRDIKMNYERVIQNLLDYIQENTKCQKK